MDLLELFTVTIHLLWLSCETKNFLYLELKDTKMLNKAEAEKGDNYIHLIH